MAYATTDDGVRLYYEETGDGAPVVFVHEFAGDHRSWEPQMRFFGRRHRCIAYDARGYPPSDVPAESDATARSAPRPTSSRSWMAPGSSARTSWGSRWAPSPTLHFGLDHPERALSLVARRRRLRRREDARGGVPGRRRSRWRGASRARGSRRFAEVYGSSAARVQLRPRTRAAGASSVDWLGEHVAAGMPQHDARRAGDTALAVRPRGAAEAACAADPDRRRRRGRQQPAARACS